jgi:hypothetical protein
MSSFRLTVLASFASLLLGCAHFLRPPLACPSQSGPQWREYTSAHFLVRTDLSPPEARARVLQFERAFRAFEDKSGFVTPGRATPPGRMNVIIFEREGDYNQLAPPNTVGYFVPRGPDGTPFIVISGAEKLEARAIFQHELTHRFLRLYIANARPWLNEGLAEYYSVLDVTDGVAKIGGATPRIQTVISRRLPTVAELVAREDLGTLSVQQGNEFYAASWMLVHVMLREYLPQFEALVGSLVHGATFDEAWKRGFGAVPPDQLEARYRESLRQIFGDSVGSVPVYRMPYTVPAVQGVESERPISDGETHLLWATMQRKGSERYRAQLELARSHGGETAALHYARALYHLERDENSLAEAELVAATEARPDEERYLLVLTALRALDAERADDGGKRMAALEPEVDRLAERASSVDTLSFIGRYYAGRNKPDAGLPFAVRAVKADPTCAGCFDALALLVAEKGDFDQAVALGERALHMWPEGMSDADVAAHVAKLRKLRDEQQRGATPVERP